MAGQRSNNGPQGTPPKEQALQKFKITGVVLTNLFVLDTVQFCLPCCVFRAALCSSTALPTSEYGSSSCVIADAVKLQSNCTKHTAPVTQGELLTKQ